MMLQPGMKVRLKSGGPEIVIDHWWNEGKQWMCKWFDSAKITHAPFMPEHLVEVDDQDVIETARQASRVLEVVEERDALLKRVAELESRPLAVTEEVLTKVRYGIFNYSAISSPDKHQLFKAIKSRLEALPSEPPQGDADLLALVDEAYEEAIGNFGVEGQFELGPLTSGAYNLKEILRRILLTRRAELPNIEGLITEKERHLWANLSDASIGKNSKKSIFDRTFSEIKRLLKQGAAPAECAECKKRDEEMEKMSKMRREVNHLENKLFPPAYDARELLGQFIEFQYAVVSEEWRKTIDAFLAEHLQAAPTKPKDKDKRERTKEDLHDMLEDVVNELDLSNLATQEHGPMGTPPAELVRLVLEQKDMKIAMLKAGMVDASPAYSARKLLEEYEAWGREHFKCMLTDDPRYEISAMSDAFLAAHPQPAPHVLSKEWLLGAIERVVADLKKSKIKLHGASKFCEFLADEINAAKEPTL